MRVTTIVGARPQFVKAAVLSRELRRRGERQPGSIEASLVHTGQHTDANMSDVFFRELDLPAPDVHLGVSGGSHGEMTGRMLERIEAVLQQTTPDWVLVLGDTNSTLAGALAAAKLRIPVAHVEAGLRSFSARTPEEINRRLTDHAAQLLFPPTEQAAENLRREGIDAALCIRTGDVMYDALLHYREDGDARRVRREKLGITRDGYILATIHRAENTDDPARLRGMIEGLTRLTEAADVVLPLHPRTRPALARNGLLDHATSAFRVIDPVGYLDMIALEEDAGMVATDSGGVQKEAYLLGVPCLTMRDETEWVELVEIGANTLVGADPDRIERAGLAALGTAVPTEPLYGTGRAAAEIVAALLARSPAAESARVVSVPEARPPRSSRPRSPRVARSR